MSNLLKHAEREFDIAGWNTPEEGDLSIDPMNQAMMNDVKNLLKVFSKQGHSGFSGSYAISLFTKLANFDTISPLTGQDDEWADMSSYGDGSPMFQNKRCGSVFKDTEKGIVYDSTGMVFTNLCADGTESSYTSSHSRVNITFPYTPTSKRMTVTESIEIHKDYP